MKKKKWYLKSKTIWTGIALVAHALLGYYLTGEFNVQEFLAGVGLIGLRHAVHKGG